MEKNKKDDAAMNEAIQWCKENKVEDEFMADMCNAYLAGYYSRKEQQSAK
jgi:hypothetical protein